MDMLLDFGDVAIWGTLCNMLQSKSSFPVPFAFSRPPEAADHKVLGQVVFL